MTRTTAAHHLIVLGFAFGALGSSCPHNGPTPRPAGGSDGTARWAYAIAQPRITAIAADAELREIFGADIFLDGRMPADAGDWSFVAWSPSTAMDVQVTVLSDGTITTPDQRADAAPGPGIVMPLTSSWADSSTVFAATDGHRDAGATIARLVVLNVASYATAPNQAVWGINFDAGANQLVGVDGTYLGAM